MKYSKFQAKGREFIESKRNDDKVKKLVTSQLGNLEESYLSLQATSQQIKVLLDHHDLQFF